MKNIFKKILNGIIHVLAIKVVKKAGLYIDTSNKIIWVDISQTVTAFKIHNTLCILQHNHGYSIKYRR